MNRTRIAGVLLALSLAGGCGSSGPTPVPAAPFEREPAAPTGVISQVQDVAADANARIGPGIVVAPEE